MTGTVVVGPQAAAHAQEMLAAAQRFAEAVREVTRTSTALASTNTWEGAAAEQYRAEQRTAAAHLQAVGPAVMRMATGAVTVIQAIDHDDAVGVGSLAPASPGGSGGYVPGPTTGAPAFTGYPYLSAGGNGPDPQLGAKIGNDIGQILLGAVMMFAGAGGEVAGIGLDATGVGAVIGVPANVVSAGVIASGAGLALHGALDLGQNLAAMTSSSHTSSSGGGSADGGTNPSRQPDPNAKPTGDPAVVRGDAVTRRSLELENESADILARAGYDVEQNPDVPGAKNPDFRIEGKIFDNYAPKGNENTVYQTIQDKVTVGQADRLVLNLADSRQDANTIAQWLKDYPVKGLREVIFINKDGSIQDLPLP